MKIDARGLDQSVLKQKIAESPDRCIEVTGCCGQRYLAAALDGKSLTLYGTPGNALGAYLDGASVFVKGNAQDAVGDTMNGGLIAVDGMAGDAVGYAMRGGAIYIHGSVGYRCGVHMKAYHDRQPLLVVGGSAGSFLGEYQAGGAIVVLGLDAKEGPPAHHFCGMGMYGGRIWLRGPGVPEDLSAHLLAHTASPQEMEEIRPALKTFARLFHEDQEKLYAGPYQIIEPNSANPYKQLYVAN